MSVKLSLYFKSFVRFARGWSQPPWIYLLPYMTPHFPLFLVHYFFLCVSFLMVAKSYLLYLPIHLFTYCLWSSSLYTSILLKSHYWCFLTQFNLQLLAFRIFFTSISPLSLLLYYHLPLFPWALSSILCKHWIWTICYLLSSAFCFESLFLSHSCCHFTAYFCQNLWWVFCHKSFNHFFLFAVILWPLFCPFSLAVNHWLVSVYF